MNGCFGQLILIALQCMGTRTLGCYCVNQFKELQVSQSHLCGAQDHGADSPGNYAKAHGKMVTASVASVRANHAYKFRGRLQWGYSIHG